MKVEIDWSLIEQQVAELAIKIFKGYGEESLQELKIFREKTQDDLIGWLVDLSKGDITQKNFDNLVLGQRDLAEMQLLKRAGLLQVKIDEFTDGVLQIVIEVAKSSIKF